MYYTGTGPLYRGEDVYVPKDLEEKEDAACADAFWQTGKQRDARKKSTAEG